MASETQPFQWPVNRPLVERGTREREKALSLPFPCYFFPKQRACSQATIPAVSGSNARLPA